MISIGLVVQRQRDTITLIMAPLVRRHPRRLTATMLPRGELSGSTTYDGYNRGASGGEGGNGNFETTQQNVHWYPVHQA